MDLLHFVFCCMKEELMQWHFKYNDLNILSADCKVNGQMKHTVHASLCSVLVLCCIW